MKKQIRKLAGLVGRRLVRFARETYITIEFPNGAAEVPVSAASGMLIHFAAWMNAMSEEASVHLVFQGMDMETGAQDLVFAIRPKTQESVGGDGSGDVASEASEVLRRAWGEE